MGPGQGRTCAHSPTLITDAPDQPFIERPTGPTCGLLKPDPGQASPDWGGGDSMNDQRPHNNQKLVESMNRQQKKAAAILKQVEAMTTNKQNDRNSETG